MSGHVAPETLALQRLYHWEKSAPDRIAFTQPLGDGGVRDYIWVTAQAFTTDGFLRTGDKGSIDPRGNLTITGRVKDLFKTSKGKHVAPAPIEDKLVMHASVEACCVTGANLGQPLALVMLNLEAMQEAAAADRRNALERSLVEHLQGVNAMLDPHEQLECLVVTTEAWTVDNDLITPTFKVRRNRIEERFADHFEQWERMRKKVIWQSDRDRSARRPMAFFSSASQGSPTEIGACPASPSRSLQPHQDPGCGA